MLTKVYGSAVLGVDSSTITIEVNVDKGIGYHLVGLPDNAIRESNYRIAAALQNNGFKIPGKKLILNMSPADMRKEGSAYDLTLAMGILVATGQIKETNPLENYIIMGELSLDGSLQPIRGALPIAIKAKEEGLEVSGSAMASDAFFPFRDGIDMAASSGIASIIQPGGSIKDEEVIAAADENNIAMLFTGIRHFRH